MDGLGFGAGQYLRPNLFQQKLYRDHSRRYGNDPRFQTGHFDQGLRSENAVFCLSIERLNAHLTLWSQRLFGQKLRIEQNVGDGRLGLVRNVGDEGFDLRFSLAKLCTAA